MRGPGPLPPPFSPSLSHGVLYIIFNFGKFYSEENTSPVVGSESKHKCLLKDDLEQL